ncbi:beta-ketoacyl synthase chain length factor [bacterium SCSIO 12741]|nr:beta-ketoacyl synthase chain length factor [bacterium SCSIO 12741]
MEMYLNGIGCVAPQNTSEKPLFAEPLGETDVRRNIVKPNYKEYINPAMIRRMGTAIKMGVVASKQALSQAGTDMPDAIIAGTGLGCQQDSEKFLTAIIDHDEQFLTPTSFIQSTHNTVAGQVALMLKCRAYNFTYCHRGFSFENTLVDAALALEEGWAQQVLALGVDEMTTHTLEVFQRIGLNVKDAEPTLDLLKSEQKGSVYGEGATAFVLSHQPSEHNFGRISAVKTLYKPTNEQQVLDWINSTLQESGASLNDIDLVLLGKNGNPEENRWYEAVEASASTPSIGAFKHLVGEYHTASAFALWLGASILQDQEVPEVVFTRKNTTTDWNRILIYNQYDHRDHSLILLEK